MKRYLLFLLLLGIAKEGYAQQLPVWVQSPPSRTHTYYYRVSQGMGLTEEEAGRKAFVMAIMESAFAIGIPVDMRKLEKIQGDSLLAETSHYVKIPINKVCQYTESLVTRRGYRVYVLCQVANDVHTPPAFKSFNCTTNKEEE